MKRELRVHSASVFQQFAICGINPRINQAALFSPSSQLLKQSFFYTVYNYMSTVVYSLAFLVEKVYSSIHDSKGFCDSMALKD